eukprot:CAMPEP_0115878228 /NCGR_PEP_ID=MMETSP0287-20121206/26660_1 /TAXON_ID=412157 /ORGANISM="Chrysochromulina rotalis, Strain UIO044" /LENGTH=158 /DNA_ID=CAMNT_0003333827 /DNA_START=208 /DNA_END=684 /DNA_ORIENTATION=+
MTSPTSQRAECTCARTCTCSGTRRNSRPLAVHSRASAAATSSSSSRCVLLTEDILCSKALIIACSGSVVTSAADSAPPLVPPFEEDVAPAALALPAAVHSSMRSSRTRSSGLNAAHLARSAAPPAISTTASHLSSSEARTFHWQWPSRSRERVGSSGD